MPISDNELLYLREQRNGVLRNDVDPKTMEAFNKGGGAELSIEWKTYRQALLDMTKNLDSNEDIVWPTKPE
ncbi:MAG TPA: hypothetical protein DEZ08_09025 [Dehalococcoidia bacterium]|jgi:hypothetical protein|nr:hypothetical protein [Dehalococcoidia bacterium]|tara:strand:- start:238 stop:450 length:213 start_codon:yes stop_codon:yes gene_type:complete